MTAIRPVTLLALAICSTTALAEETHPESLAGFLKPGTHLGIRSSQTDSSVQLYIYSEDRFQLAVDAQKMDLPALEEKYPAVAAKAKKVRQEFVAELQEKEARLRRGEQYGEPSISIRKPPHFLCTVQHVGSDYILVSHADDKEKAVFAFSHISRIHWASENVQFNTSATLLRLRDEK